MWASASVLGHIEWHIQGEHGRPSELMSSLSGKYPVAIHGIWSFPPSLHVNQASRMHYMGDYLQEMFVFTQMLITLDKPVFWKLERKLRRREFSQYFFIQLLLAHFSGLLSGETVPKIYLQKMCHFEKYTYLLSCWDLDGTQYEATLSNSQSKLETEGKSKPGFFQR